MLHLSCRCSCQHRASASILAGSLSTCSRRHIYRCRRSVRSTTAKTRGADNRQRGTQHSSPDRLVTGASLLAEAETQTTQPGTGHDFFDLLRRNVPWERIGVWLVVAIVALNLKDFFGVSGFWLPLHVPPSVSPAVNLVLLVVTKRVSLAKGVTAWHLQNDVLEASTVLVAGP